VPVVRAVDEGWGGAASLTCLVGGDVATTELSPGTAKAALVRFSETLAREARPSAQGELHARRPQH
jgi:hypothetical protein